MAQQARLSWQRVYCQLAAGHATGEPRLVELALDRTLSPQLRAEAARALVIPTATPEHLRSAARRRRRSR